MIYLFCLFCTSNPT